MNSLEAAYLVLMEAGKPLRAEEITKRMLEQGLWHTAGRTPDATVEASLNIDIKQKGLSSRFCRVDKGTFALNEIAVGINDKTPSFTDADEHAHEKFGKKGASMLNQTQHNKVLELWTYYLDNYSKFINASGKYSQEQLDTKRIEATPFVKQYIEEFVNKLITIDEFKTKIDGFNKKNRLWGFEGISGQMYFNMLYNASSVAGLLNEFSEVLYKILLSPKDITIAKHKIEILVNFSNLLYDYVSEKIQAPRTRSCIYFISYFWQIQERQKWPIYYRSMVDALINLGFWNPTGDPPQDYVAFYNLNQEISSIIENKTKNSCSLWDIEHVFWLIENNEKSSEIKSEPQPIIEQKFTLLPDSFIPPIVSIIPQLAKNDPELEKYCKQSGTSLEKIFEDRIATLFKMLGYTVESLGQGLGRVPDGIATNYEDSYAIFYDAKARTDIYSINTSDERAIKEYISRGTEKFKKKGIKNFFFVIISNSFKEDIKIINFLRMETGVQSVILLEAEALLTMLELKLKNPDITLGQYGFQQVFIEGGIVTSAKVKELVSI